MSKRDWFTRERNESIAERRPAPASTSPAVAAIREGKARVLKAELVPIESDTKSVAPGRAPANHEWQHGPHIDSLAINNETGQIGPGEGFLCTCWNHATQAERAQLVDAVLTWANENNMLSPWLEKAWDAAPKAPVTEIQDPILARWRKMQS